MSFIIKIFLFIKYVYIITSKNSFDTILSLYSQFEININQMLEGLYLTNIAVAVSGGVDSMVLLYLADLWAKKHSKNLTILTVNHNLRSLAAFECDSVIAAANQLSHKAVILNWQGDRYKSNMQAQARESRYELMTHYCHAHDILVLLTAHHHDDYLENFAIRQERKSGLLGQSSSYINFINDVMILRPLYDITKEQLINEAKKQGVRWFEDASNNSSKYLRSMIRNDIAHNQKLKSSLTTNLLEVNDQARTLTIKLIAIFASIVTISSFGFAVIDKTKYKSAEYECKLNILNLVLTIIGGKTHYPRYNSVKKVIDHIQSDEYNKKLNLHGCCIITIDEEIYICRDFGRILPNPLSVKSRAKWDNRFSYQGCELCDHYITYIRRDDYSIIKEFIPKTITKEIVLSLPCIYHLEKLVAIPHISYYNDNYFKDNFELVFEPAFISRFLHFC